MAVSKQDMLPLCDVNSANMNLGEMDIEYVYQMNECKL